jgi:hypothetical protein
MGARNRVGIGLARQARLAELVPWNRFLSSLKVSKFGLWFTFSEVQELLMTVISMVARRKIVWSARSDSSDIYRTNLREINIKQVTIG